MSFDCNFIIRLTICFEEDELLLKNSGKKSGFILNLFSIYKYSVAN